MFEVPPCPSCPFSGPYNDVFLPIPLSRTVGGWWKLSAARPSRDGRGRSWPMRTHSSHDKSWGTVELLGSKLGYTVSSELASGSCQGVTWSFFLCPAPLVALTICISPPPLRWSSVCCCLHVSHCSAPGPSLCLVLSIQKESVQGPRVRR